ncbi:MAG: ImmA/IrrE family metallo-endopeptidase [Christensenellaceae bacterium]|nr:ImmA/IrrE family metallo-endopeptidase [Christensenellaceae bacterium]
MILSRENLEEIAAAVMMDFGKFFFQEDGSSGRTKPRCTPIDQLATQYLGLDVCFARLSPDGSVCGVTAYDDTEYEIVEMGVTRKLKLKRNEIVLDRSFIEPGNLRKLCGKRRFTLAHECAHQILFQMESNEKKCSCRKMYEEDRTYSVRELKSREDWNEWQANVLGAAILMPRNEIALAMRNSAKGRRLIRYGEWFTYPDRLIITMLCNLFGVSRTAITIRLSSLGYMEERPFTEYVDPLEVMV